MTFEVDTHLFEAMCQELSDKAFVPPEKVIKEETGRILSRAVELTDAADAGKIRTHSEQAKWFLMPVTLKNIPPMFSKRQKRKLIHGRVLYKLNRKYPNALWNEIQAARAADLALRLAARGLAKQSWWKIGQLLHLDVDAPAYVKKAKPRTKREYPEDEQAEEFIEHDQFNIVFENSQPTVNAIGGDRVMQKAIDGRVDYFIENVDKAVFDSITSIARKYPGIYVE